MELVEALLLRQRQESPWMAQEPERAVANVYEHAFGWLVAVQSVEYIRSRDPGEMLIGQGPYLVDRQDGSIHHIPVTTFVSDRWEELYRQQVKGVRPPDEPDPLLTAVQALVHSDGMMAAMRHLRKQAPLLEPHQAKAYVTAVKDGREPPAELVGLIPKPKQETSPLLSISTLAGGPAR
ncbi:YrhB domain-containing protein [Kitasatospora sp. MBT63]|uniref:YrhB domain-containing protein n=1 Tax=Kitasatospora sp. MBT63 TaxID=1444768 RepID=UPI001E4BB617|nr:YrhB domain-containing protein [Kitasatospora sp. MBT63]